MLWMQADITYVFCRVLHRFGYKIASFEALHHANEMSSRFGGSVPRTCCGVVNSECATPVSKTR